MVFVVNVSYFYLYVITSSKEVLRTVVCHVWSENLKDEEAMDHVGPQSHGKKEV
jgi:hypothetical protein